jgi:two-component system, chemotaxis family, sensor kinase CheA
MDDGQDPELLSEFVSESLRGLQSVEQDLLILEEDGGSDVELVNRIFRAVHSIKGSGSFLRLENLVTVSHQAETLLDDIRAGRRGASADVTDAVLGAIDALVAMLEEPDQGANHDCTPILGQLSRVLETPVVPTQEAISSTASSSDSKSTPAPVELLHLPSEIFEERDPELLSQFIQESLKGLEDIEQDLLALETDGGTDRELVNRIFRAIHSIKGAASFLRLNNLVSITHRAETVLDRVRSGMMEVTAAVTDATLAVVDAVVLMLRSPDYGESHDCAPIREKLDGIIDGNGHLKATEIIRPEDRQVLQAITDRFHPIYKLELELSHLHEAIDIKEGVIAGLSSVGKVRHASIPIAAIDTTLSGPCTIFFETMLGADILSHHLHIDERCITPVDLSTVDQTPSVEKSKANAVPPVATAKSPEKPTPTPNAKPIAAPAPSPIPAAPLSASKELPVDASSQGGSAHKSKGQRLEQGNARTADEQTMRVPARILHELLEWTGNMVMARNQLLNEYDFRNSNAFRTLSQAITGVHETVIETRMQTTGSLFDRYRRVVRDLSRQLSKEVAFHIEGGDLELDRTILESFADPLTHLVRNCIDHAIETPDERLKNGKNRQGNVYLRSYVQSGEIILEVEDDGRGISASHVCSKAIEKGLITAAQAADMTDEQKVMLIFAAGFSTKDQATDVSGRGVGMDVVRNNIESVGGTIDIKTRVNEGSTFAARLPLAKALVSSSLTSALVIEIGNECLAIPETAISEIIHYDQRTMVFVRQVDGRCVYQHRDKLVALIDLRKPLGLDEDDSLGKGKKEKATSQPNGAPPVRSKRSCLVIIQFRDQLFGTVVDEVVGMQEIIVRSNPQLIQDCTVYSGHTVLGNGRIALILDINGIVNKMALKFPNQSDRGAREGGSLTRSEPNVKATTQKMLIFNNADSEYFAIPIELVAFIERIQQSDLKLVGTREFCQLKAETLSIVRLESFLPVTPLNRLSNDMCLIRPAAVEHPIGVITGLDLHVVDVAETYETRLDDVSGILGTFYFNEKLVMLIDLFCVLEKHAPEKLKQTDDSTQHARILIAEDSLFFRKLIAQYIQRDEWEVEIVNDGMEAYERLMNEPNRFNLLISDINMPRMDGFELAKKVREDKRFDSLPMVALTTMSDEYFREKGIRLGFDRYVIKIDKREVRATVTECLKIKRSKT